MYDMAHTIGLYGAFQEPLADGVTWSPAARTDLLRAAARGDRQQYGRK